MSQPDETRMAIGGEAVAEMRKLLQQRNEAQQMATVAEAMVQAYTRGLAAGLGIDPDAIRGLDDESGDLIVAGNTEAQSPGRIHRS